MVDKQSSNIKNSLHGFFLSIGTTIAEPAAILPLMIHYFSGSSVLVGVFASLLKGGAIFVQMFSAFYAQSYKFMLPYLRLVFLVRFLAWFSIGIIIKLYGETSPTITLFGIGIALFVFSFSAGFGAIYFKEILAKIFSHKFRGKSMAYRQFFSGLGAIISGATTGWFLQQFDKPDSFAYLFMISAIIMGFGFIIFSTIQEPPKEKIKKREGSFFQFLQKSFKYFYQSKQLKYQILSFLFSYSYLIALPFIILDAKEHIQLNGYIIGLFLSAQMTGRMLSNLLWGKLSSLGKDILVVYLAISLFIISMFLAIMFHDIYIYGIIFFIIGAGIDGTRLAFGNLILIIAPPELRSVYVALQANISSIGLFFPIFGGVILEIANYNMIYFVSVVILLISLFFMKNSYLKTNL